MIWLYDKIIQKQNQLSKTLEVASELSNQSAFLLFTYLVECIMWSCKGSRER